MTQDKNKAIDLILKNLRMAESAQAIGSLHEAEAFAEMAQKLMVAHKLSLSDVETTAYEEAEPIGSEYYNVAEAIRLRHKSGRVAWTELLANAVCRANFCRILVHPGSKTITIIGRESDRAVAKYLFTVLADAANRMQKQYVRQLRREASANYEPMPERPKQAFLLGFVRAVADRLAASRVKLEQEAHVKNPHALVRLKTSEGEVQKYTDRVSGKKSSNLNAKVSHKDAFNAGYAAGKSVNLNPGVGGGGSSSGHVGAGQRRLGGAK